MARFGLLALNRGIWNGDTLLKEIAYFNAMVNTSQTYNPAYGYLWWLNGKSSYLTPGLQLVFNGGLIPNAPADMFCALGKNDQKIYVVPSQSLVVVRQGNAAEAATFALSNFDDNLWDYMNKLNCTTSAIEELSGLQAQVAVYPNPSSSSIYIQSPVPIAQARLVNMLGQSFELPLQNNTLDVLPLSKGSYVLQLFTTTGLKVYKKVMVE